MLSLVSVDGVVDDDDDDGDDENDSSIGMGWVLAAQLVDELESSLVD